jgi:hypothetical protein
VALVELHERIDRPLYATDVGETEREAVGAGFVSEHEAVEPPFKPLQFHVQVEEPLALLALVPVVQM